MRNRDCPDVKLKIVDNNNDTAIRPKSMIERPTKIGPVFKNFG